MLARIIASLIAGALLSTTGVTAQAASRNTTINGFDVTVSASQNAPSVSGVYHTGGAGSMSISFAGAADGSVDSDGTYMSDTYWDFVAVLWYDANQIVQAKGTTGFPPTSYLLPGGMVGSISVVGGYSLSGNPTISAGGHTANTDMVCSCQNFSGLDLPLYVKDSANFSVINP